MKKILVLGAFVAMLASCNTKATTPTDVVANDSTVVVDSAAVDTTVVDSVIAE